MFRVKISNFIKNNIHKIKDFGTKLMIVAIVVFIATIILLTMSDKGNTNDIAEETYKPEETVIKGSNVSKKQYELDQTIIEKFLDKCNNRKIEEAYSMISEDCKKNIFQNIDIFKQSYYDVIFKEKRLYNLQSWVSTSKYTVYRIRYTNDILATGKYDESKIYNDYITLIKKQEKEEISIGSFILTEEINKTTEINGIKANVLRKNVYLEDEEYEIEFVNNTNKTILLDSLKDSRTIKLFTDVGNTHQAYVGKLLKSKLTIKPGYKQQLTIEFKKSITNSNKSKYIKFLEVIKDYEEYTKDTKNYENKMELKINL